MSSGASELTEIVRAGAGAGKTSALVDQVLRFVKKFRQQHNRLPRVVVTTFTRKATEELRERLLKEVTGKSADASNNVDELVEYISSGSALFISTIHGVLSRYLRQYGHLLGLDGNFTIITESAARRRDTKLTKDLLVKHEKFRELLNHLTVRQLAEELSASVEASMFHENPHPVSIDELRSACVQRKTALVAKLARVAQEAAAECLVECGGASSSKVAGASKSQQNWLAALKLYGELAERAGVENDSRKIFNEILTIKKPNFMSKKPVFSEHLHKELVDVLDDLETFAAPENEPEALTQFAEAAALFSELRDSFMQGLDRAVRESGQLEMRDIERFAVASINQTPELVRAFGSEWDYWLVDEFQDTSPLQVKLLREFVRDNPAYYVGDPQQSIYLFRGARREVFQEKEHEVDRQGGRKSLLRKNYRSNPSLLLFFNDIFSSLSGEFTPMEPKETPTGAPVVATFYQVEKEADECYAPIVQHIQNRLRDGERPDAFCVLARRNNEIIEIARELERYGIPTHVYSGGRFFDRREILDLLSIVKFLLNPHDNLNLVRLLRSPWFHVHDSLLVRTIEKRSREHSISYWQIFARELYEDAPIRDLIQYRDKVNTIGVFETLRAIIHERGIIDHCAIHDATGVREANVWKFLFMLRENERAPGFQYLEFINDILFSNISSGGDEDADAVAALVPNRVNLMTIHKSKGLKFRHVILPNLHARPRLSESRRHESPFVMDEKSGRFSLALKLFGDASGDSVSDGQGARKTKHCILARDVFADFSRLEREELDRLFYVAMTRAEESVVLHAVRSTAKNKKESDNISCAEKLTEFFHPGRHVCQHYTYEVLTEWPAPQPPDRHGEITPTVRPLFMVATRDDARSQPSRMSVTELVEKRFDPQSERPSVPTEKDTPATTSAKLSATRLSAKQLQQQLERPVWGQKLHAYFERLKYGAGGGSGAPKNVGAINDASDIASHAYFAKWFGTDAPKFVKAAEYTLNLQEPPIRPLIEVGEVEWGFQLKTETEIIEGQIDLWGTIDDVTWLVDYKSGSAVFQEKAFYQLELYTQALRAFGIVGPIRCAVVYALDGEVVIKDGV